MKWNLKTVKVEKFWKINTTKTMSNVAGTVQSWDVDTTGKRISNLLLINHTYWYSVSQKSTCKC